MRHRPYTPRWPAAVDVVRPEVVAPRRQSGAPGPVPAPPSPPPDHRGGSTVAAPPHAGAGLSGPLTLPPLPAPTPQLLRVLEGAVVDFPVPVLHPDARCWAATCWPDDAEPSGWARALWWPSPYHRRGQVPVALAYADVVEFGADVPVRRWGRTRWWPVRWYGLALEERTDALVVHGAYPTPDAALAVAEEVRATLALRRGRPHA